MISCNRICRSRHGRGGFTLVEALVAFAILVMATVGMIWSRSDAVKKAAEARNLRLAMKIARETLDRFEAGMVQQDIYELNDWLEVKDYPEFKVKVVTRMEDISIFEEELASTTNDEDMMRRLDLNERLQDAREYEAESARSSSSGQTGESTTLEEDDELTIDEETTQDLVIGVRYPSFNLDKFPDGNGYYVLRLKLSTLAISGMTPEEAEDEQESNQSGSTGGPGL